MRYMKMLGLAAVLAGAFMAFVGAGSASAAGVLCLKNQTPCETANQVPAGTEIKASLKEGKLVLTAGFGKMECEASEVNGHTRTIGEGGSAGLPEGPLTKLSFSSCNGTVETLEPGSLSVSWTSLMNGNVTASGFKVHTVFAGVSCLYGGIVSEKITFIGGAPALIKEEEAPISKIEGGILCGSPAHWTATYKVTEPTELWLSPN